MTPKEFIDIIKMDAKEFIDIIKPEHDRDSCSDEKLNNGFYSRNGRDWYGRCTRCMYLEIAEKGEIPVGFDGELCTG